MTANFKAGDLVWAKMRHFPAWPAKVVDPPSGAVKKDSCYVFFYGSQNYAWVKRAAICSYKKNCNVQRDVKNSLYQKAIKEISEEYQKDILMRTDYDFVNHPKPKRSKEEEEARYRKIQKWLKVRLFPLKSTKKKLNTNNKMKKNKKFSQVSSSSSIITVKVQDYRKVVPKELMVLLRRCDVGSPALTSKSSEPECNCEEGQPPTLLSEL